MLEAIGVVHTCTKDHVPWACREGLLKEQRACDQGCDEGTTRPLHYQERGRHSGWREPGHAPEGQGWGHPRRCMKLFKCILNKTETLQRYEHKKEYDQCRKQTKNQRCEV